MFRALALCLMLPAAAPTGPQTLTYWVTVREMIGKDAPIRPTHKFDQPLDVRRENDCRDLEQIPTAGVDPELVAFINTLIAYAPAKGKADATLRWYHRYTRLPAEVVAIRKRHEELVAEAARIQKALTKRYGVTFPKFEMPDW